MNLRAIGFGAPLSTKMFLGRGEALFTGGAQHGLYFLRRHVKNVRDLSTDILASRSSKTV
jgi:hypothetical protein